MRKLVSVYNRRFRHLNSTGPKDPTATVYMVSETDDYPTRMVNGDGVRFLATQAGGIIWAPDNVRQSISRDGETIKPELLLQILSTCHVSTVAQLDVDFIPEGLPSPE